MYSEYIGELIKHGKLKESLNLLLEHIENNPYTVAFCDIGYLFINLNNYNNAIFYLNLALRFSIIDKEFTYRPTIYLNLSVAHKMKGDKENLNSEYNTSLKYLNFYFDCIKNKNDDNISQAKQLKEELDNKLQIKE